MESFAFWYKKKINSDNAATLSAILHFNLWCECGWDREKKKHKASRKGKNPFLDIGFKIINLKSADELYFFLPFSIPEDQKLEHIEDLGCKFKETALVDALFNKNYATTISANSKAIDVNCANENDQFKIYQLDVANDISLTPFGSGTILTIKTDRILQNSGEEYVYYFRFRIKDYPLDFLIHKYSSPNKVLQSLFNTTFMIDFRYHNIRSLDNSLVEKFHEGNNQTVNVTALHFFLMTKAYVDVSSSDFKRVRKIEHNIWEAYVDGHDTTDLVAYHYVDKADTSKSPDGQEQYLNSSELFTKFRVERAVIPLYIFCTILLGIFGSLIGSALFEGLRSLWKLLTI